MDTHTDRQYELIGRAFVGALTTSRAMGHTSPAGLADYIPADELGEAHALVIDAFASTRRDSRAQIGYERVSSWLGRSSLAAKTRAAAANGVMQ